MSTLTFDAEMFLPPAAPTPDTPAVTAARFWSLSDAWKVGDVVMLTRQTRAYKDALGRRFRVPVGARGVVVKDGGFDRPLVMFTITGSLFARHNEMAHKFEPSCQPYGYPYFCLSCLRVHATVKAEAMGLALLRTADGVEFDHAVNDATDSGGKPDGF